MENKDTFRTINTASDGILYKAKNSKFYGYVFPLKNENDVKCHISELKKTHVGARHCCYAYQLGEEDISHKTNDDGEPNNSAGAPIYGQIQAFDVTNVLIVVVRYFGGVKLGVGGLISAYKTAAQMALASSEIKELTINENFQLSFEYKHLSKVLRLLRTCNAEITHQSLELNCKIETSIRKRDAEQLFEVFKALYVVNIKIL